MKVGAAPVSFGVYGPPEADGGFSPEQLVAAMAWAGYEGAEFPPAGYAGCPGVATRLFRRNGLVPVGIYIPIHFADPELRIGDEQRMEEALRELEGAGGGSRLAILADRGEFPDQTRVEMTWLWLPSSPAYRESFEVHGTRGSLELRFPNPYLRGVAASLTVKSRTTVARQTGGAESAFLRELRHFHGAIVSGDHPTDALGARDDAAFLQEMVAALARMNGLAAGGEAGRRQ